MRSVCASEIVEDWEEGVGGGISIVGVEDMSLVSEIFMGCADGWSAGTVDFLR